MEGNKEPVSAGCVSICLIVPEYGIMYISNEQCQNRNSPDCLLAEHIFAGTILIGRIAINDKGRHLEGEHMDKPVALGEVTLGEGVDSWNTIIFLYNSALKEVRTKVEILNDEFQQVHQYNPIEYIKSRIKAPESIVKKLKRYGYDSSIDNMVNYINDIAGIRIVCSFTSDIYRLAEMIGKQNDLTVISVKDYIRHPKESGYKSYHMLVTVPIFLSDCIIDTKVEIQIRTMAMDFWASLEHKIYYKFEGNAPDYISRDLRECSGIVSMLDAKMLQLNEAILEAKAAQEEQEGDTGAV